MSSQSTKIRKKCGICERQQKKTQDQGIHVKKKERKIIGASSAHLFSVILEERKGGEI